MNYLGNIINSQKKYGNEILFILEKLKAELVTKDIYEGRIKLWKDLLKEICKNNAKV